MIVLTTVIHDDKLALRKQNYPPQNVSELELFFPPKTHLSAPSSGVTTVTFSIHPLMTETSDTWLALPLYHESEVLLVFNVLCCGLSEEMVPGAIFSPWSPLLFSLSCSFWFAMMQYMWTLQVLCSEPYLPHLLKPCQWRNFWKIMVTRHTSIWAG